MQGTSRTRGANRLTALELKKATRPGILEDGAGLRLIVSESNQKHWVVRVTIAGKRVSRGLGPFPDVSLLDARQKAEDARRAARAGKDAVIETKREATRNAMTFRDAFSRYFEEVKRPTLKPGRFAERWPESMQIYVYDIIGDRPVSEITPGEIISVLQPLWHTKRETATRVLQRMSVAFRSAIVRGDRLHANPCDGVRDELGRTRPKVQHRRALPWRSVPSFVVEFEWRCRVTSASRLALLFVVHSACRSEEVRGARWSEIDLEKAEWTVPASRMKMKREHIVPLSTAALAVLARAQALRRHDSDLIFPSQAGSQLSDNTLSKLMRDAKIDGTPHGFRTSFKVWASEHSVRDEVSEAVLAHGDPDKVRAAYRRTTFLDDRRRVMEEWSKFIAHSDQIPPAIAQPSTSSLPSLKTT